MKSIKIVSAFIIAVLLVTFVFLKSANGFAHSDNMDGPVIKSARTALDNGDVKLVLIWVTKKDEPEIIALFNKTLSVRKLGPEAKELADQNFFKTLVRMHRLAMRETYTGLKPAGRDVGPVIPAVDMALDSASLEELNLLLQKAVQEGLERHFNEVRQKMDYKKDDIEAGRRYVGAYHDFIQYAQAVYDMAKATETQNSMTAQPEKQDKKTRG